MYALSPIVLLVAVAAASASILAGPGVIDTAAALVGPSGTVVRPGLAAAPGAAIAAPLGLGLGLAGPLGLGVGAIGVRGIGIGGIGIGGLGVAGIAAPAAVVSAGPLGVRVTTQNLRVAPAGAPVGVLVPAGNGLEGQYVPDISEKLHDDGAYKPEIYGA